MQNQQPETPIKTQPTQVQGKRPWHKPALVELPMRNTESGALAAPEGAGPFTSAIGNQS